MTNLDATHYVPVLKVKANEKKSLEELGAKYGTKFSPLLELVERNKKSLASHLDTSFRGLASSVAKYSRCYLDTREVAPSDETEAGVVLARADAEGISYVPVIGLTRPAGNVAALNRPANGFALRLTRAEMEAGNLAARIGIFTKAHGLEPERVDLIMDMGDVSRMVAPGVVALAGAFLSSVPNHKAWRTFILSGSAFPGSMGGIPPNSFHLVGRHEWVAWRDSLYKMRAKLTRLPTFSDCGIQNPQGVEGVDWTKVRGSAAARYSSGDNWLLVKGVSLKAESAKLQYPKIAARIVSDSHGTHFAGGEHCVGCGMVVSAAGGAAGLGSRGKWRRIGTTHHIVTVLDGLAALHWP